LGLWRVAFVPLVKLQERREMMKRIAKGRYEYEGYTIENVGMPYCKCWTAPRWQLRRTSGDEMVFGHWPTLRQAKTYIEYVTKDHKDFVADLTTIDDVEPSGTISIPDKYLNYLNG
jgi:hypothetical protein